MNKSNKLPAKSPKTGYELLLQGNYLQAASFFEQAIEQEPDIQSHYWYLGLILLLQGQEVEAQTTWLMAIMAGDTEESDLENTELREILKTEAERQEKARTICNCWED